MSYPDLPADISSCVRRALSEDIGAGDLTADLVPANEQSRARVLCREQALLCGSAWFDEVFRQLDERIEVRWLQADGAALAAGEEVCHLQGPTRSLLSGERTALNLLQLLSGTATTTRHYVEALGDSCTRLLDTRKTIPGLRSAQKYAVACGGGRNHRMGLYDAILIKENHIRAAGGIGAAVSKARAGERTVEVEVESLAELEQALGAGADIIMLDNFSLDDMQRAVTLNAGRAKLEVSGGVVLDELRSIAATGVDYISVGALTKHLRAIDYSMLFESEVDAGSSPA